MTDDIRRAGQVAWAAVGIAILLVLLGMLAWAVRVVFAPLLLAGAVVFVLNPLVTRLQRHGVPRAAGAGISYLGIVLLIAGAGLALAPLVSDQVSGFRDDWPTVKHKIDRWVDDRAEESKGRAWEFTRQDLYDAFSKSDLTVRQQIDRARAWGTRIFHVLLIMIIGPVIAFYVLVDLPHLRRVADSLIPARARPEVLLVGRRLSRAIGGFFRGQLLVAFIVGLICSAGLLAIGLRFWLLIGMIAGVFNIIPLVGPWIGGIPGVVVALTTADLRQAFLVVVVMVLAQQIDNHFITPYVMQRAVKLHPAAVILALLTGGSLAGFAGLLIAVPAAAVLKIVVGHVWRVHVLDQPLGQWPEARERADEDADGLAAGVAAGVAGVSRPVDGEQLAAADPGR